MTAIDFHSHAFPDEIAPRAMAKLQAMGDLRAEGDGAVSGLIASMDAAGVDVSVVCPIATKPGQASGIERWCGNIRGERIEPFCSLHPDDPDPARIVRGFAKAGFSGVKLHPHYQNFIADEPRMETIYKAIADAGLILAVHCGCDFAFSDDDDRAGPVRWARVLDAAPGLRCVLTHMGGYKRWDQVQSCILGRDVYIETSFSLTALGPDRAAEMIRLHGAERVLFGTDWPWQNQADELERLSSLPLSPAEILAVAHTNAAGLLGREVGA